MEQLYSYLESLDDCEIEMYFEDQSILDNCIIEFKENCNSNIIKKLKKVIKHENQNIYLKYFPFNNDILNTLL